LRAGDSANAAGSHREIPLGASAALRRRVAVRGRHQPLLFEPIECRIERAGRRFTFSAFGNLTPDRDAVGVVTTAKDGEEDDLLEFTQG
jgi:hypothetical protein